MEKTDDPVEAPTFDTDDLSFDVPNFLAGDDIELEFDIADFNFDNEKEQAPTRIVKPTFPAKPIMVDYKNAKDLVSKIKLYPGEQIHSVVRGDFIFGDFLEALLVEKNVTAKNVYLSTLSLSQENADSLAGLLRDGYIVNLTIMVSNYFYSHEKNRILKYLIEKCDIENRLSVIVVRNHTKIALLEVSNIRLVLSGSSNLRSSRSIEQFVLQESQELYEFYRQLFTENEEYSILKKEVPR